jgi:hypothetical protein
MFPNDEIFSEIWVKSTVHWVEVREDANDVNSERAPKPAELQ